MKGTCTLLILVILGITAVGCSGGSASLLGIPVTVSRNNVNISVDPRVELMAVVQYLSSCDDLITQRDFPYRTEVDEHFAVFQGHEAVTLYEEMVGTGFKYSSPANFALSLTFDVELDDSVRVADHVLEGGGGEGKLREFASSLRDFCVESSFPEFFANHEGYYLDNAYRVASILEDKDYVTELQDYYGIKYNSYNIIPVPLYGAGGGFGPHIERGGIIDVYSVLCPFDDGKGDIPNYGDKEFFKYLQRHEFSHSYVNRITEMYYDEAMKYQHLLSAIENEMKELSYGTWITCLNEHIVRAVTTRLAYTESRFAGDSALAQELEAGFIYTDEIMRKLEEYEENRDKYPDFIAFYPELLKALD